MNQAFIKIDHWSEYVPRILVSRVVSPVTAEKILTLQSKNWEDVHLLVEGDRGPFHEKVLQGGVGESSFFKVLLMDLPWPVANRWVLQKEMDRVDSDKTHYSRRFVLEAGNLVVAEGYWRARQHPSNPAWSLVYYENSYDPGFQVPEFLFKPLVRSETRGILEAVRKRAESL